MTEATHDKAIEHAFLASCEDELNALKPGNVHIHADGHRMDVRHFQTAAKAAAPHVSFKGARLGERILSAVTASFDASGCNTNLGIILLCAPLAVAAEKISGSVRAVSNVGQSGPAPKPAQPLRNALRGVLANLDKDDATDAFAAIAYANPAGLGESEEEDVNAPPQHGLRHAMSLAAERDRIARAYVTDFEDIFEFGLPVLVAALAQAGSYDLAITTLHMNYLAQFEDSHIQRKHGLDLAGDVRDEARNLKEFWSPAVTLEGLPALTRFDADLKARGLNPGTTADLVVATLFARRLSV